MRCIGMIWVVFCIVDIEVDLFETHFKNIHIMEIFYHVFRWFYDHMESFQNYILGNVRFLSNMKHSSGCPLLYNLLSP